VRGYQEASTDTAPEPLGYRAYFDTGRDLPGMLKVIEINAAAEEAFHNMQKAARKWSGNDYFAYRG
jgi:hypothetical protein